MSTSAQLKQFEFLGGPMAPVSKMGLLPSELCATAAGLAAANVIVKNPTAGSWDTFVGLVATAGYLAFDQSDNGSDVNGTVLLIPTLIKTVFP